MPDTGERALAPALPFVGPGFHGEAAAPCATPALACEVARLVDPAAALETVHWGRNYLYAARFDPGSGPLEVVVKQFRNQGLRRRVERRLNGSKAARSWRAARALLAAGLGTPEPLLLVESDAPEGPSFFVTRRLQGAFEVRHFFRRLNRDATAGAFPDVEPGRLLAQLGRLARALHDAGIWYRDLSIGNVLARPAAGGEMELYLVDPNRARVGVKLGLVRRCRDICRLPVLERPHREAFLRGYWGELPARRSARWWLYAALVRGYLLKHAVKGRWHLHRRPAPGGRHHAHIPPPTAGAEVRDRVVWDRLADQPHQHARPIAKLAVRLADSPSHLRDLLIVARAAPRVVRRYRELRAALYREPVRFDGLGVALRPWPDDPHALLAAVDELGVRRVLLRLHPWEKEHDGEEALARELAGRGLGVSFALPQNRDLVRDPMRWQAAVEELAERFTPYGSTFQVGQAPNRSKWGLWSRDEYVELFTRAAGILRRRPGVQLLGPAVIDFEHQVTAALVNRRVAGLHFDVVSSLLYVDRRGPPEATQLGFDTVAKVVLLRAIAETGRCCGPACWITEVNWPLWEGPHAPAGRRVAVDEERQADYLVRYELLALGTGLVELVFWWQLVARGYGLVCPEPGGVLRRRPAFFALRTLVREVEGSLFLGPLPSLEQTWLYRFRRSADELVVGWSLVPGRRAELPRPAAAAFGRDGHELPAPATCTVELGPTPRYFVLAAP